MLVDDDGRERRIQGLNEGRHELWFVSSVHCSSEADRADHVQRATTKGVEHVERLSLLNVIINILAGQVELPDVSATSLLFEFRSKPYAFLYEALPL